jgi:hypothetical protein
MVIFKMEQQIRNKTANLILIAFFFCCIELRHVFDYWNKVPYIQSTNHTRTWLKAWSRNCVVNTIYWFCLLYVASNGKALNRFLVRILIMQLMTTSTMLQCIRMNTSTPLDVGFLETRRLPQRQSAAYIMWKDLLRRKILLRWYLNLLALISLHTSDWDGEDPSFVDYWEGAHALSLENETATITILSHNLRIKSCISCTFCIILSSSKTFFEQ